jgi:hypothetical protein
MSLYFSGKDAYNSGNYAAAQQYFQEALVKDENIEAKAQNIKYMLGVSAFNNKDYKTAKTYLVLFPDNPIANDLLQKIEEFEKTLPEDFLYHNENDDEKVITPSPTHSVMLSTETAKKNNNTKQSTTIIIIITTIVIMSVSVFLEIKKSMFSKIALKLVGVTSDTILIKNNQDANNLDTNKTKLTEEVEETQGPELNTMSLLETPFDEEIDIEEMASKDIKEISRFFDEVNEEVVFVDNLETESSEEIVENNEENKKDDDFESARDSILNSILDDEEPSELEDQENQPENKTKAVNEVSKKPKYEHLDNIPDDFNVNSAIDKAFKLIEETNRLQTQESEQKETEDFKSIGEMEKELEEQEKLNLDYFQEMEEIDDASLKNFLDYVFEQHLEVGHK